MNKQPVKVLTIGGSDSGGAAGIQADLKTWTALGVYGMSVITAVTAQNSIAVEAVQFIVAEMVAAQIDAVLSDYGAAALKTGFLGRTDLVQTVAGCVNAHTVQTLVVDPVLVNHKGESMFPATVAAAYREYLLPGARLATPNWREAGLLTGVDIQTPPDEDAILQLAGEISDTGCQEVFITGVPVHEEMIIDWWFDGDQLTPFMQRRIVTDNRHGSGDTLSAAICANLALGMDTPTAIQEAQGFTSRALAAASDWRLGQGHGPLSHFFSNTAVD